MSNANALCAPKTTSLSEVLLTFIGLLQLDEILPPESIPDALREMEAELLGIGADAYRAEIRGAPLSEAVRDFDRCPSLAKLHAGLEDMLTLSLPKELLDWARRLISNGVPAGFETILRSLVAHARRDENPVRRSLCRLLVFEAVRVQLLLRTRLSADQTYGIGMSDEEVDAIAESETNVWMDDVFPWTTEVESLEAIAIAGLIRLERHLAKLRMAMRTVNEELRKTLARRARFEARLLELDVRDALLIRNACAEEFDVQRLSLDLVRERHPAVFGDVTRGAMDTRLSRLRNSKTAQIIRRKDICLIDLLRDAAQLPVASSVMGE